MKKIILCGFMLIGLILYTPVFAESGYQDEDPANGSTDQFTFNQLGFTETRLMGPFDSTGLQVSFPEEWEINLPAELHLEYSLSVYGADYTEGINQVNGLLNISVNNNSLASIPLNEVGDAILDLAIAPEKLISQQSDGRLDLSFDLISQESCERDIEVVIVIRETSYLKFSHATKTPVIDLTLFPRPFFQPDALYERKVVLVIPDNPSESELQAAMDISAGFGSLSGGGLALDLLRYSDLSNETLAVDHLVLIGKPASLPILAELDSPIPLSDGKYDYTSAGAEDGLVQLLVSPWEKTKAILIVSGNTDVGIVKSGQAIKSGEILTAERNDVSFVKEYRPHNPAPSLAEDQSFLDLGYDDRTINYAGTSSVYIDFYIPPQQQVGRAADLNLNFTHSEMLSFANSGMTIFLNGRAVSSIQFQEDTAQLTEKQVKLPASAFVQGINQLLIQIKLVPIDECSQIGFFNSTWATIFSDSYLHLPQTQIAESQLQNINLSGYPDAMLTGPTEGILAFVLNSDDGRSLKAASEIAFSLGDQAGNLLNQITVVDIESVNEESLNANNVMLIGRPGSTSIIYDLKEFLPAPFEKGSEVPLDNASKVVYRVVPGSNVGYLEMFESPWGSNHLAMLVSANSDEGLEMAVNAITGGDLRGNLAGNFAIISGGRIISLDTRFPVDSDLLADTQKPTAGDLTDQETPQIPFEKRNWMIPMIVGVSLLTLIVILIILIPALRKSKQKESQ